MITFENGPAHGVALTLQRAPFLLRVVMNNKGEWDALDQPTYKPEDDEQIFVYWIKPERVGTAFVDGTRNGKRHGWMSKMATYEFAPVQPEDGQIRGIIEWRKWCEETRLNPEIEARFGSGLL